MALKKALSLFICNISQNNSLQNRRERTDKYPDGFGASIFDRIKLFLSNLVKTEEDFSSEAFESFMRDLSQFLASIGRNLLKHFLELNQPSENQLEHEGRKYFYKKTEDKKYATLFGKITVSRRVYFNSETRMSLIPLEKSLHMEKQFATVEVRELIGYLSGFLTPKTIWNVVAECDGQGRGRRGY